ncbi:hypothetical protein [Mesorhizobium sp. M0843]|uniref:hypothetical protein n=1 Tax=Mesorhizobium sp. M0843 TaxID=2957010 RepID=UPI003337BCFB
MFELLVELDDEVTQAEGRAVSAANHGVVVEDAGLRQELVGAAVQVPAVGLLLETESCIAHGGAAVTVVHAAAEDTLLVREIGERTLDGFQIGRIQLVEVFADQLVGRRLHLIDLTLQDSAVGLGSIGSACVLAGDGSRSRPLAVADLGQPRLFDGGVLALLLEGVQITLKLLDVGDVFLRRLAHVLLDFGGADSEVVTERFQFLAELIDFAKTILQVDIDVVPDVVLLKRQFDPLES